MPRPPSLVGQEALAGNNPQELLQSLVAWPLPGAWGGPSGTDSGCRQHAFHLRLVTVFFAKTCILFMLNEMFLKNILLFALRKP